MTLGLHVHPIICILLLMKLLQVYSICKWVAFTQIQLLSFIEMCFRTIVYILVGMKHTLRLGSSYQIQASGHSFTDFTSSRCLF